MIVYGIKTCDTCRKAIKTLGAELRDIRVDPLSKAERSRFFEAFGADLLNTRSTTWRTLSDEERARDPDALLEDHPTLMKRPVIDHDGQLYLGWGSATKDALL